MIWRERWGLFLSAILLLPVFAAVTFWLWIRQQPGVTLDVGAKCWDVFINLVSALTATVSGAMLFRKYIEERAEAAAVTAQQAHRELALREAEFLRQRLLFETQRHERKVALLREAKTIAARIASTSNPDAVTLTRFNELYYADLIGTEEKHGAVEAAMVGFRRQMEDQSAQDGDSLELLSLQLSAAVERELQNSEEALLQQHRSIADLLSKTPR